MTIAISLKVHDGLVLAADSATTVLLNTPAGQPMAAKVYENACKVTNLRKGMPLGCITWGAGSIGNSSIATLTRDLRREFSEGEKQLTVDGYTVKDVATRLRDFMLERWRDAFKNWPKDNPNHPGLGFVVGGYSANSPDAEEYRVQLGEGEPRGPDLLRQSATCGVTWNGEPEALSRLVLGVDPQMSDVLVQFLGVDPNQVGAAIAILRAHLERVLIHPAMPIQDAIDLAKFMVELTIGWKRFTPGAPTVGGPIEIAAITRHEGFKWVRRKHYYSSDLNPDD